MSKKIGELKVGISLPESLKDDLKRLPILVAELNDVLDRLSNCTVDVRVGEQ